MPWWVGSRTTSARVRKRERPSYQILEGQHTRPGKGRSATHIEVVETRVKVEGSSTHSCYVLGDRRLRTDMKMITEVGQACDTDDEQEGQVES